MVTEITGRIWVGNPPCARVEFVTQDGVVFENKLDALSHENSILEKKLKESKDNKAFSGYTTSDGKTFANGLHAVAHEKEFEKIEEAFRKAADSVISTYLAGLK